MASFLLSKLLSVFVFFLCVGKRPSIASVLLSPSGNVSLCNGEVHNFTCEVTGASLLWIFDSDADAVYSSSVVNSQSLGPHIDTWFVSAVGGVVISNATVTGSPALNRTTLQCRNSSGFSSITFNIVSPVMATYINASTSSDSNKTCFSWERAKCAASYNFSVNGTIEATTDGESYCYTPQTTGIYTAKVVSLDYLGNRIDGNPLRRNVSFDIFQYNIIIKPDTTDVDDFIIEVEAADIAQYPILNCTAYVNNMSRSCNTLTSVTFPDILKAGIAEYIYLVIITNVVGSSVRSGRLFYGLLRETVNTTLRVTPSPVIQEVFSSILVVETSTVVQDVTGVIGDPVVFSISYIVLILLMILCGCCMSLRICWKRRCCCPRVWRNSCWNIFFCYDCFTLNGTDDPSFLEKGNVLGQKNPSVGEKSDTTL